MVKEKENKTTENKTAGDLANALIAKGINEIKIASHGYNKTVRVDDIPDSSLLMLFNYGVGRKFNDTINSIKTDEKKDEKFYLREIDVCIDRLKNGWESSTRSTATGLKAFILKTLIKKDVLKKEKADTIKGLDPLKMLCEAYPNDTVEKNQERLDKYTELFDLFNNMDVA